MFWKNVPDDQNTSKQPHGFFTCQKGFRPGIWNWRGRSNIHHPLTNPFTKEAKRPWTLVEGGDLFQEKRGSRLFSEKYMGKDFSDKFLVNFDRSLGKNLPEHVSTNQVEGVFSNLKRGKGFSSYPMYTFLLNFWNLNIGANAKTLYVTHMLSVKNGKPVIFTPPVFSLWKNSFCPIHMPYDKIKK